MAVVKVRYTATFVQVINWPENELDDLNYENLECNLDIENSHFIGDMEIDRVELNGKEHNF